MNTRIMYTPPTAVTSGAVVIMGITVGWSVINLPFTTIVACKAEQTIHRWTRRSHGGGQP